MSQRIASQRADVIVIGGGAAGVMAALAGARRGAATVLVERGPAIGGYVGRPWDGPTMHGACVDAEVMAAGTRRVRDVDVAELRRELIADGAVIEGTA